MHKVRRNTVRGSLQYQAACLPPCTPVSPDEPRLAALVLRQRPDQRVLSAWLAPLRHIFERCQSEMGGRVEVCNWDDSCYLLTGS